MATVNYNWNLPTVGGSEDAWGTQLNANWTDLDTLLGGVTQQEFALLSGQTSLVPAGAIVMWSGSVASIPSGWYICDGNNGTPDLTGRFVVHADADSGGTYAPGDTGGADDVTLTEAQMPAHTHSGNTASAGSHSHTINNAYGVSTGTVSDGYFDGSQAAGGVDERNIVFSQSTDTQGNHAHSFTTGSTGGGSSHENRPPYYALAYIMKA
jgi:microcystin-dependent protein